MIPVLFVGFVMVLAAVLTLGYIQRQTRKIERAETIRRERERRAAAALAKRIDEEIVKMLNHPALARQRDEWSSLDRPVVVRADDIPHRKATP